MRPLYKIIYPGIIILWVCGLYILIDMYYIDKTASIRRIVKAGPLGFELRGGTANRFNEGLYKKSRVPFNMRLPSTVNRLSVRITGIDIEDLAIIGDGQYLNGNFLEIRRQEMPRDYYDSPPPNVRDLLMESTTIKFSPEILKLLYQIIGHERNRSKMVCLINSWVYNNIEKVGVNSIPLPSEVLRTRKGDCTEHTALFAALSRAAGIPTRIATGLLYYGGSFYYHSWPEVFLGKWIPVDPTIGMCPADAGRIRLMTGELFAKTKLIYIINSIRIEGISYR